MKKIKFKLFKVKINAFNCGAECQMHGTADCEWTSYTH